MSSLTDMVLMPGADYQDICNAVREKSGGTAMLKSGDIAAIIRAISGTVSDLGAKLYTFGAISDAHMPYGNGPEDFRRAIPVLEREGAEFIIHAGDIGMDSAASELETWQGIVSELANVPVYSCNGNHDLHANDNWLTYIGHDLNHVFEHDGDVFILLSITSTTWETPYGADTIQWLRQQLTLYAGRRIFLVTHLPLPGYAGLRPNTYYGFSAASTEDDEILALMNSTKNVIHLSGHTHFYFQVEEQYDGINVVELNNSDSAIVHIPSLNYPRTADNTADNSGSQGYIVNVYERGVVMRAYDFIAGAYLEGYEYHLPIRNGKTDVSNVIMVSDASITVAEGGSATFGVRLMLPPVEPVTVTLSVDNGLVSLDKTELVFTTDNYAQEQIVTVTAHTDEKQTNASSVITMSAAGMQEQMVSVTIENRDEIDLVGNLIPKSINADGSPFNNGMGYIEGYRCNSAGELAPSVGDDTTGFMPCKPGDIIYSDALLSAAATTTTRYTFFNSNFTPLGFCKFDGFNAAVTADRIPGAAVDSYGSPTIFPLDAVVNAGVADMPSASDLPNICWFRATGSGFTDNTIITVNEPI